MYAWVVFTLTCVAAICSSFDGFSLKMSLSFSPLRVQRTNVCLSRYAWCKQKQTNKQTNKQNTHTKKNRIELRAPDNKLPVLWYWATTTSSHNPLYVLCRCYWMPQSHSQQPHSRNELVIIYTRIIHFCILLCFWKALWSCSTTMKKPAISHWCASVWELLQTSLVSLIPVLCLLVVCRRRPGNEIRRCTWTSYFGG